MEPISKFHHLNIQMVLHEAKVPMEVCKEVLAFSKFSLPKCLIPRASCPGPGHAECTGAYLRSLRKVNVRLWYSFRTYLFFLVFT